jgi:pimeloyl-ACP methyl ester carboxylesterase
MAKNRLNRPEEALFDRQRLDVGGVAMHARVSRLAVPPNAPEVVFVHGLGLSGRYMLPTAARLARSYRVSLPDLPGFGDSDHPEGVLDVAGLADALAGWMRAAGIGRAALFGNSHGCQIIADLAARFPERVERAVMQGPTTPPDERSWLRQFVRWRQHQPYNPRSVRPYTQGDYSKAGAYRVLRTFQYALDDPIEAKLPRIAAPVLVVRGGRDPICRPDWAERVARLLPRGRLVVIPGVAHTLVDTSPLELERVCRPFLDEAAS